MIKKIGAALMVLVFFCFCVGGVKLICCHSEAEEKVQSIIGQEYTEIVRYDVDMRFYSYTIVGRNKCDSIIAWNFEYDSSWYISVSGSSPLYGVVASKAVYGNIPDLLLLKIIEICKQ